MNVVHLILVAISVEIIRYKFKYKMIIHILQDNAMKNYVKLRLLRQNCLQANTYTYCDTNEIRLQTIKS